jgi:hypothetical protein
VIVEWLVPVVLFATAVVGLPALALWRHRQICRRAQALRLELDRLRQSPPAARRGPRLRLVSPRAVDEALAAATFMPILMPRHPQCREKAASGERATGIPPSGRSEEGMRHEVSSLAACPVHSRGAPGMTGVLTGPGTWRIGAG